MNKKSKIWNLIFFLVGVIGIVLMINFGTVIIKPSGHIIDEKFINQCKILYLVRDTLTGVFILMTVGSILFAGFSF